MKWIKKQDLLKSCLKVLLVFQIASMFACSAGPESKVGKADFKLPNVDGSWVELSNYQGKKSVLLYFWATWCPACLEIKPQVARLRRQVGEDQLEILAINVGTGDSFERVKKFQKGQPMPWPVLYDKEGQVATSYGVQGIPLFVLVDKEGDVVYRDHLPPENPKRYF